MVDISNEIIITIIIKIATAELLLHLGSKVVAWGSQICIQSWMAAITTSHGLDCFLGGWTPPAPQNLFVFSPVAVSNNQQSGPQQQCNLSLSSTPFAALLLPPPPKKIVGHHLAWGYHRFGFLGREECCNAEEIFWERLSFKSFGPKLPNSFSSGQIGVREPNKLTSLLRFPEKLHCKSVSVML